jgi:hypothetical protein
VSSRTALRGVWRVVVLADWMEDQFVLETRAAWGEARPACPGHRRHPAQAEEVAGAAWWVCPIDRRPIAPPGSLGAGQAPVGAKKRIEASMCCTSSRLCCVGRRLLKMTWTL